MYPHVDTLPGRLLESRALNCPSLVEYLSMTDFVPGLQVSCSECSRPKAWQLQGSSQTYLGNERKVKGEPETSGEVISILHALCVNLSDIYFKAV
jgi:hypothetical protein